ncbi:tRNA (adenosine(37)-N6)-threonylcarbamoyltransferase complex dimerization subunit type 1 TsaB [Lachnoclostridium sp. Marseille-P6806]|uniref:tRNA (adenosine(37)-N6)-threonylcarbamoyltransferase complex dimerization subunit type 1 TsaB n=1 Tax=Lachnoclostridium sp. Marseille-P6806 TaxID=2364793 RepID=UPI00102F5EE2|nr:tRNA (adenosine(37)-N6)-threonylcarbamoyltransferase complex dimerization subunit type 1 TsaB [Lachnoclostridium sp. Marseille-P6806]
MKLLSIETSGQVCGVALLDGDTLTADYNVQYKKTHSQSLVPMLDEIRSMCGLELSSIDAIALTGGPGSFTGIRIGAATAKGLGLALAKPLIPVPTADSLAYNLYGTENRVICPLMDARRSQVYTGFYEFVRTENPREETAREEASQEETSREAALLLRVLRPQCAVSVEETAAALNALGREVIFLGDGAPVYRERLRELMTVPHFYAPPHLARQRAASTAALAMQFYREQGETCFVDPDSFRPEYLRLSQAERERAAGIDTSQVVRRQKTPGITVCPVSVRPISVRPMEERDVVQAAALESLCSAEPWSAEEYRASLGLSYASYYVAVVSEPSGKLRSEKLPSGKLPSGREAGEKPAGETETVVGVCGVRKLGGDGEITNVAVHPDFRRQGMARRMLERLIRDGRQNGITAFTLEVRAGNAPAIALYEGIGFRTEGVRPGFYSEPAEDALIQWLR